MTDKQPPKRFTFKLKNEQQQQPQENPTSIRDKDNAQPRIKPPLMAKNPSPRMGPPGTVGIKRNLPKPVNDRDKAPKRFTLGKGGELGKTFKPIVTKPKGKDHGFER